jgi:sarcosine oxidase subunit alpha
MSRLVFPPTFPSAARPPQAKTVTVVVEGKPCPGQEGEPVAAALWALGIRSLGWTEANGRPRGLYCAIGHCMECRVVVDGQPDRRACLEPVREGLQVYRQPPPPPLAVSGG